MMPNYSDRYMDAMVLELGRAVTSNNLMQVSQCCHYCGLYYMQRQRQQIVRKARKLLSRDRSSQLHKINRVAQKQPEEKRVVSPTMIPQQKIIKGLRNQLTNLKEQVAKLTFRQQKKPLEANQINLQYRGYCDQQNKEHYNVPYSKNGKYYRREKKKSERAKSEDSSGDDTVLIKQPYKKEAKIEEIIKQFKEFKLQNQHLMHQNQKLRNNIFRIEEKLRYSQDGRLKSEDNQSIMIENSKIRCQTLQSHSYLFKKQNEQQRVIIQQLKETLQISTQSNMLLKQEIQLLRENSSPLENLKAELNSKTKQLELLRLKLQEQSVKLYEKQHTIEELRLQLQKEKELVTKLTQQRDRQAYINNQNKMRLAEMKNKIIHLQKTSQSSQNKKESKRKPKQSCQQLAQLQQIIRMQQKSMNNYESDLSYLQKQLKKHHHFKLMYEKMATMLEQANQECIRLNLCLTVTKYKPF